jgi:hypothetical protein
MRYWGIGVAVSNQIVDHIIANQDYQVNRKRFQYLNTLIPFSATSYNDLQNDWFNEWKLA